MLTIGKLRKRIVLQSRDTGRDASGQQVTTWTNVFGTGDGSIWGGIEALFARELFAAQAVQSEVSHKITVRYRAELANPKTVAAMRATYAGRIFNISGAMNIDERNRVIELLAAEGLNNG